MAANQHSKRFSPTAITEKIVPILLVFLLIVLLSVIVIVGLSLIRVIPTA